MNPMIVISFTRASKICWIAGAWIILSGFSGRASASRVAMDEASTLPFRFINQGHEAAWDLNLIIDHRDNFRDEKQSASKLFSGGLTKGRLVSGTASPAGGRKTRRGIVEIPAQFKEKGSAWSLSFQKDTPTARVAITISGNKGSSLVRLATKISYLQPTFVQQESLEIGFLCDDLSYMNRAERMSSVVGRGIRHHVDRWTHKRVDVTNKESRWSVIASPNLSSMTVERMKQGKRKKSFRDRDERSARPDCSIVLTYDDARNHPAVYAARCQRRWYPPSPRILRSRRFRRKGEEVERETWFYIGNTPRIAHKARLPRGYAAAISFTDHADQSAPGPLKALLIGRSDGSFSNPPGGFIGNGLGFTKTLFHRKSPRPQMEHAGVRKMVEKASAASIEFGLHSATPGPDDRKTTEKALKAFAPWGVTWIDHQPDTNCESYSSRGWDEQSEFFIADLLHQHGFRYVWTGDDVSLPGRQLNMLRPERPEERASFLFPFHVSTRHEGDLWLFRSVWFYVGPEVFSRAFSKSNMERFVQNRGIFIAHTYLDSHHPPGHRRHGLALIRRHREGYWHLHPQAEGALSRLGRAQRRKEIWTTSMRDLGNHLSCWDNITLRASTRDTLVIKNPGGCALDGFAFRIHDNKESNVKPMLKAVFLGSASALSKGNRPVENGVEPRNRKRGIPVKTLHNEPWTTGIIDLPRDSVVEVSIRNDPN